MVSGDKDLRIELIGASYGKDELVHNIISTTAFEIMEGDNFAYNRIISHVIEEYYPYSELKHIYLMDPFLWKGFEKVELEDKDVIWKLMIPITNKEKEYAIFNGWDDFESKIKKVGTYIFDITRRSIV